MNKNILKENRGIAPLIIVIIVAVAAVLIGGGIYLATMRSPEQKKSQALIKAGNAVDEIGVSIPNLDFSQSPLPDLNISSLNMADLKLTVGSNVFKAPSVNTDFSYNASINIATPSADSYNINLPSIPSGAPAGQQIPPNIPSSTGSGPQSGQQGGAPSVDCSQFASVPSCSMTGPGEAMCKQCYPNK